MCLCVCVSLLPLLSSKQLLQLLHNCHNRSHRYYYGDTVIISTIITSNMNQHDGKHTVYIYIYVYVYTCAQVSSMTIYVTMCCLYYHHHHHCEHYLQCHNRHHHYHHHSHCEHHCSIAISITIIVIKTVSIILISITISVYNHYHCGNDFQKHFHHQCIHQ